MPTTTITTDHETEQRTAIIRTPDHAIRVTEHVDSYATCSLLPDNPRHRCKTLYNPKPMNFDQAVSFWFAFLDPFASALHVLRSIAS